MFLSRAPLFNVAFPLYNAIEWSKESTATETRVLVFQLNKTQNQPRDDNPRVATPHAVGSTFSKVAI